MIALSYRSHYTLSLKNATSLSSRPFKHQINDGKYLLIQLDRCNRSSNQPFTHTLSKIMLKVIITHKGWTIIIKSSYKMSEQQINCYILIRYRQKNGSTLIGAPIFIARCQQQQQKHHSHRKNGLI